MVADHSIDFQTYLESLSEDDTYRDWQDLYTSSDHSPPGERSDEFLGDESPSFELGLYNQANLFNSSYFPRLHRCYPIAVEILN